jgi:hypothetical protein
MLLPIISTGVYAVIDMKGQQGRPGNLKLLMNCFKQMQKNMGVQPAAIGNNPSPGIIKMFKSGGKRGKDLMHQNQQKRELLLPLSLLYQSLP